MGDGRITVFLADDNVIVREGAENLSEMAEDEEDRLDMAEGLTIRSRLGCQAVVRGKCLVPGELEQRGEHVG